jgi:hypothetical protein
MQQQTWLGFSLQRVFLVSTIGILGAELAGAVAMLILFVTLDLGKNTTSYGEVRNVYLFMFKESAINPDVCTSCLTQYQQSKIVLHYEVLIMPLFLVLVYKLSYGYYWFRGGQTRSLYIKYFAASSCFYIYCCFLTIVLTFFQGRWASAELMFFQWTVFLWAAVAGVVHWRHMEFKDKQAFNLSVLTRQTLQDKNRGKAIQK